MWNTKKEMWNEESKTVLHAVSKRYKASTRISITFIEKQLKKVRVFKVHPYPPLRHVEVVCLVFPPPVFPLLIFPCLVFPCSALTYCAPPC